MATTLILCDLDDTLVVERSAAQAAFLATCERAREIHGLDPAELTESVRTAARGLWRAAPTARYCRDIGISSWEGLWARFLGDDPSVVQLRSWAPTYRLEAWSRALAEHGVDDPVLAQEMAGAFGVERRSLQAPFPDTQPALRDLVAGYRLAVFTNGTPDLQREKLALSGLAAYFEAVFVSGELGFGKPDPRVFQAVIERTGLEASELVMVGDSLKRDIAGAQQAGIKGVWMDRGYRKPDPHIIPDARITVLADLKEALETIDRQEASGG